MKNFYELLCLLWFKNNINNFVVYQPNGSKAVCRPDTINLKHYFDWYEALNNFLIILIKVLQR